MIMILVMTRSFKFRKLHGDNDIDVDVVLANVDEHYNCIGKVISKLKFHSVHTRLGWHRKS